MNQNQINELVEIRKKHRSMDVWTKELLKDQILFPDGFMNETEGKKSWKVVWQEEEPRDAAHNASDPNKGREFTEKEWNSVERSPDSNFHMDKLIYIIPIGVLIIMYTWLIINAIFFPKPLRRRVRKYKAPRTHMKDKNQPKITPIDTQEDTTDQDVDYESSSSSDDDDDDQIKSGQLKIKAKSRIGGGPGQKTKKVGPSRA